jgi:hypothetical protein
MPLASEYQRNSDVGELERKREGVSGVRLVMEVLCVASKAVFGSFCIWALGDPHDPHSLSPSH